MTLGEMRTLLRIRINDINSQRLSDTQLDTELNLDARFISREVSKLQRINYLAASENFTTVAGTKTYALASTTMRRVFKVMRNETNVQQAAVQIREEDRLDYTASWENGEWKYYVTRDPTTKLFSINFPQDVPGGLIFTVQYILRTPEVTAGGAASQEFTSIDSDWHELIVQRAVLNLLSPESVEMNAAAAAYADLYRQMREDLAAGTDGETIQDEFVRC